MRRAAIAIVVFMMLAVLAVFAWRRECDLRGRVTSALAELDDVVLATRDLEAERDALLSSNERLEELYDEVRATVPAARAIVTARLSTGKVIAAGTARDAGLSPAGVMADTSATQQANPIVPCLVAVGDTLRVDIDELVLDDGADHALIIGTAKVTRLEPPPETVIAERAFELGTVAVRRPRSWGVGPWVSTSLRGTSFGAIVATPPVRLWMLEIDGVASATLGAAGPEVAVGAVVRLRN